MANCRNWADWTTLNAQLEFREQPVQTLARAESELSKLYEIDPLEWRRASLVIAITEVRAGADLFAAKRLVAAVQAEVGLRFDVLSTLDTIAAISGSGVRISEEELIEAAERWDEVAFVAGRWVETAFGLGKVEAVARAKAMLKSAPPIETLSRAQRMEWLRQHGLFIKSLRSS